MGTQQLLLIAVGIVVVVVMIFTGYNYANSYFESSNRDQLISILNDLAIMAQQHYKKPKEQGGGGNTYTGWEIPKQFKSTDAGNIKSIVEEDKVNFTAEGVQLGRDNNLNIKITARLGQQGIRITVIN